MDNGPYFEATAEYAVSKAGARNPGKPFDKLGRTG
jgi:hypothetical protein